MCPPYRPEDDDEAADDARRFRDPGGVSALHPGPRTRSCPTCKAPKVLTKADREAGYQCDRCAEHTERWEGY